MSRNIHKNAILSGRAAEERRQYRTSGWISQDDSGDFYYATHPEDYLNAEQLREIADTLDALARVWEEHASRMTRMCLEDEV